MRHAAVRTSEKLLAAGNTRVRGALARRANQADAHLLHQIRNTLARGGLTRSSQRRDVEVGAWLNAGHSGLTETRDLREELSDRAAENIKSEVKLRDVETELSVARASPALLATGVLDYTEEEDEKPKSVVKSVS